MHTKTALMLKPSLLAALSIATILASLVATDAALAAKALSLRAARAGGMQPTHGPLPTSAATMRPCPRHHC